MDQYNKRLYAEINKEKIKNNNLNEKNSTRAQNNTIV